MSDNRERWYYSIINRLKKNRVQPAIIEADSSSRNSSAFSVSKRKQRKYAKLLYKFCFTTALAQRRHYHQQVRLEQIRVDVKEYILRCHDDYLRQDDYVYPKFRAILDCQELTLQRMLEQLEYSLLSVHQYLLEVDPDNADEAYCIDKLKERSYKFMSEIN